MSEMDKEFQQWLKAKGINRVQTQDDVDAFLYERNLPKQVETDVARWKADHPGVLTEANTKKLNYWLRELHEPPLPATYENITAAYEAMKGVLQLPKPTKPLPEIETRPGVWKNGVFRPDPSY